MDRERGQPGQLRASDHPEDTLSLRLGIVSVARANPEERESVLESASPRACLQVYPEGARTLRGTEVPPLPLKLGSSSMVWPVLGFSQTTFWRRTWVTLTRSPVERQHSFPQIS